MVWKEQPLCGHNSYSISHILQWRFQGTYWTFSVLVKSSDCALASRRHCSAQSTEYMKGKRGGAGSGRATSVKYNPFLRPWRADSQKPITAISLMSVEKLPRVVWVAILVHPASGAEHCMCISCVYRQGDCTAPRCPQGSMYKIINREFPQPEKC